MDVKDSATRNPQGQGLTGELIGEGQDLQRAPLQGLIEDEVIGPDVAGVLRLHANRRSSADFSAGLRFDGECLFAPDSPNLLPVEVPSLPKQQGVSPPG
jgi:hypothetical protein